LTFTTFLLTTRFSKILGFGVLLGITVGCSAIRNLPEDGILLRKNSVFVDNQLAVDTVANIVQPKPNNRFLGIPFGLLLYQSAKDSTDSCL